VNAILVALALAAAPTQPAPATTGPEPKAAPPAAASAVDPFAGLRFLVGEWTAGSGGGAPGQATAGGFTFRLDLDGRVAVRRSFSEYPPRPGEARGPRHEDLTVVRAGDGALKATYWDNEGHEIEYAVTTAPGQATFLSAGPGPRFRLEYREAKPGEVTIDFAIAPPGADFTTYVSGTARRTAP
jgi:hypothetical protein